MRIAYCLSSLLFFCNAISMDISGALDLGRGYSVLTVTRDRIPIKLNCGNSHYATPQWEYAPHNPLNDKIVKTVLSEISKILRENTERFIFVVFNEYFFSKEVTLTSEFRSNLFSILCEHSKQNSNAIYCVNFLYYMNSDIPECEKEDLTIYTKSIDGEGAFAWSVLSTSSPQLSNKKVPSFLNESVFLFKGQQISSHRKSSYYHEDDTLINSVNYYNDFGIDVLVEGLQGEHEKMASILHSRVCMEICWDIQKHIRAWRDGSVAYIIERKYN